MNFFLRQMESQLDAAVCRLGEFVGADAGNLVFVDNATVAMNVVAASVRLEADDEVLLTDHEYGAVLRIWRRVCHRVGARVVVRELPDPIDSEEELVTQFLKGVTDKTRLIVASHVTSPTAVILPVAEICRQARGMRIPVCIDGPHAVAMVPLALDQLGCDYYTASCHKWLCGPFGTGFLYVARHRQSRVQPAVVSWGGSVSGRPAQWQDEFNWSGTRDPAAFLAVPTAIEFLHAAGLDAFRRRTHQLARTARQKISALTGLPPLAPDSETWYGSMVTLPLPSDGWAPPDAGQRDPLQDTLWERHRIEVPMINWHGRRFVRVSCHLYNDERDVERLVNALRVELK